MLVDGQVVGGIGSVPVAVVTTTGTDGGVVGGGSARSTEPLSQPGVPRWMCCVTEAAAGNAVLDCAPPPQRLHEVIWA